MNNDFIYLSDHAHVWFIRPGEIVSAEVNQNYTRVYLVNGKTMLLQTSMAQLVKKISSSDFFRVRRETLVNLNHVKEIKRHPIHRLALVLTDGRKAILSRSQTVAFRDRYSLNS